MSISVSSSFKDAVDKAADRVDESRSEFIRKACRARVNRIVEKKMKSSRKKDFSEDRKERRNRVEKINVGYDALSEWTDDGELIDKYKESGFPKYVIFEALRTCDISSIKERVEDYVRESDLKEFFRKYWYTGMPIKRITRVLDISSSTVDRWKREMGLPGRKKWPGNKKKKFKQMWEEGWSVKYIAEEFGLSQRAVYYKKDKMGLGERRENQ